VRKRRQSDWIKQRNATYRAYRSIARPGYSPSPYFVNSTLGLYPIALPEELSIFSDTNRYALYKLLRQISEIPKDARILLDFRNLSTFKISAIIIFFAHLEILIESRVKTRIRWHLPSDPAIHEKLDQLGLWELLGGHYTPKDNTIKICSISHQQKENDDKRPLKEAILYAERAISSYEPGSPAEETDALLFEAVSESFSNVWQHAYASDIAKKHSTLPVTSKSQKWWIALQHVDDQLFMAVYDVGVGIPASTRRKPWYKSLSSEMLAIIKGMNSDSKDIQTALEYGHSRYRTQGRGNGLPAVKRFVEINPNGQLHIMSGKSLYRFRSKGKVDNWVSLHNQFPGTLIQWNFALTDVNGDSDET